MAIRMMGNTIPCANCGEPVPLDFIEFVDIKENPELKERILDGGFFNVSCSHCGTEIRIEYPVMYMDPEKNLDIYMVPEHNGGLLNNLNSLEVYDDNVEREKIKRLTGTSEDLIEKILIFDNNRDDRIIELYKVLLSERIRVDWPDMYKWKLLYYNDEAGEMFIVRDFNSAPGGEKLTIVINDEDYKSLEEDFGDCLKIQPGKFEEVNREWIIKKIDRGQ